MREILSQSSNPEIIKPMLQKVIELANLFKERTNRLPVFMEVCGSHTHALAESGIKQALKDHVRLISGPGCPVCVTDQQSIDAMIELSQGENRIICTFGDMMRVPGSNYSLMEEKTKGKDIRVLYSPVEAIPIAEENPDKEIIFLGIGFETTIPILAILMQEAEKKQLKNFSIWMTTKLVKPVLEYLMQSGEVHLDGFILPGHVSIVLGEDAYSYLVDDYHISGVIGGFEPAEVLNTIYKLIQLAYEGETAILNDHPSIVTKKGNVVAQSLMNKYFMECDERWRGIGVIPNSGLDIKPEYSQFNAKLKFNVEIKEPRKTKCRCGEIIVGKITPEECPLFGKACTPRKPIGPCMVSTEGSCAASYQFMRGLN